MPQTLRGSFEQAFRPLPSVVKDVQACRLPGLKCLKCCAAASSRHSGHCPLLLSAFKPATWLNARLWPQILRSFVLLLHDSIDWFRCENLSRKPYKHIISIYIYIYVCISAPLKGGRRHQGVSPFYICYNLLEGTFPGRNTSPVLTTSRSSSCFLHRPFLDTSRLSSLRRREISLESRLKV